MTVSSLWKALSTGNSGQPVGLGHFTSTTSNDTMNNNCTSDKRPQTLAIDLSIWICESLTTYGINEQHTNPTLHLVFTRTMKLLHLGLGLVFVIEGKQRALASTCAIQINANDDTFRKRRSGTAFWKACNDCQQLLELLGVPVVRAKCEGEALCALLSQRGIVDGVISNDGDCLLFGAKVVYTKYSNENLANNSVIRYDNDKLFANSDHSDDNLEAINLKQDGRIQFSRYDLIAFAVLTGSDLVGSGIDKVGYKKAIRFLRKCQLDNPLSSETAAFDEMKSWAKVAAANVPSVEHPEGVKTCSRCMHPGSKRSHEKHGCACCDTNPGEQCYLVTTEDRFRLSLRSKAIAMKFDASRIFEKYMRPNDNQIPMKILMEGVKMKTPKLYDLLTMKLIVKGHCLQGSKDFIRQSVLRLLSRKVLHQPAVHHQNVYPNQASLADGTVRPVAKAIMKRLLKHQVPCYEVSWVVQATCTDENGEGVDGYEYVTIEPQTLVDATYPQLVEAFQQKEVVQAKQGDGMKIWRREFLQSLVFAKPNLQNEYKKRRVCKVDKKRKKCFDCNQYKTNPNHLFENKSSKRRPKNQSHVPGDDIRHLLRYVCKPLFTSPAKTIKMAPHNQLCAYNKSSSNSLPATPTTDVDDDDIYCTMGGYSVQISPISSNHGVYPPKHIFVRHGTMENNSIASSIQ